MLFCMCVWVCVGTCEYVRVCLCVGDGGLVGWMRLCYAIGSLGLHVCSVPVSGRVWMTFL